MPGNSLSNIPEENEALDTLTKIEKLTASGKFDEARAEYQALTTKLDAQYMEGQTSPLREQIEDRLVKIKYTMDPPDPSSGDEANQRAA